MKSQKRISDETFIAIHGETLFNVFIRHSKERHCYNQQLEIKKPCLIKRVKEQ